MSAGWETCLYCYAINIIPVLKCIIGHSYSIVLSLICHVKLRFVDSIVPSFYSIPKSDRTSIHKNLFIALICAQVILLCSGSAIHNKVRAAYVRMHIWFNAITQKCRCRWQIRLKGFQVHVRLIVHCQNWL